MDKKYKKLIINIADWLQSNGVEFDEVSTDHGLELKVLECPVCGKLKKLYVDAAKGVAQCKYADCDWNGGISPLKLVQEIARVDKQTAYKICFGEDRKKSVHTNEESMADDLDDLLSYEGGALVSEEATPRILKEIVMPRAAVPLSKDHTEAYQYLLNRGLSEDEVSKLDAYIIPVYNYKTAFKELLALGINGKDPIKEHMKLMNRVIIPSKIDGKMYGYVARDFSGKADPQYKALNSEGSWRSQVLWNYDNAKSSDSLVICEGIFDAIKGGISRSVAIFGAAVSDGQIKLITKTQAKRVIFALDVGTDKTKKDLFNKLFMYYPGAIYEVDFEEYLFSKKITISEPMVRKVEEIMGESVARFDSMGMVIPYQKRKLLKTLAKENSNRFNSLEERLRSSLMEFLISAEYKDAGDYTKEEMEELITRARVYEDEIEDHSLF